LFYCNNDIGIRFALTIFYTAKNLPNVYTYPKLPICILGDRYAGAVIIASVAMSGGIPVFVIIYPLKKPITVVITMPIITASIGLTPCSTIIKATETRYNFKNLTGFLHKKSSFFNGFQTF
jgi:hypothetical protein